MRVLQQEILELSNKYIGTTGKSFIERQCKFHLYIEFEQLDRSKLNELASWCEISGGLILGKEQAKEFKEKILALKY